LAEVKVSLPLNVALKGRILVSAQLISENLSTLKLRCSSLVTASLDLVLQPDARLIEVTQHTVQHVAHVPGKVEAEEDNYLVGEPELELIGALAIRMLE